MSRNVSKLLLGCQSSDTSMCVVSRWASSRDWARPSTCASVMTPASSSAGKRVHAFSDRDEGRLRTGTEFCEAGIALRLRRRSLCKDCVTQADGTPAARRARRRLTHASRLQEYPDARGGGDAEDGPQHPVAARQEQERQEREHARDQTSAPQHALARLRSPADAHRMTSRVDLTTDSLETTAGVTPTRSSESTPEGLPPKPNAISGVLAPPRTMVVTVRETREEAGMRYASHRLVGLSAVVLPWLTAGFLASSAIAGSVHGTPRSETLRGTANPDKLYGNGGNDKLYGLAGNDYLNG